MRVKTILRLLAGLTVALLLALTPAAGGEVLHPHAAEASTPAEVSVLGSYQITITGEGSFSGTPSGYPFSINAVLVVTPTIDTSEVVNNGVNPVDVGIFTTVSPIVGQAGALWFGTNTSLCSLVGCSNGGSGIDIAFVDGIADPNAGTAEVNITVDGNAFGLPNARLATFNIYNLTTDLTAQIHNVLAGTVLLQITDGGQSVSGTINLGGNSGFDGPGITSEYLANFSGSRIN
jgi:hypothetical protein